MLDAQAEGVEHVVAPWTKRLLTERVGCFAGVARIAGSSHQWVRVVLGGNSAGVKSARSRLFQESDSEDEDASDKEEKSDEETEVRQASTGQDDWHRCVAEWLLLMQALATVDPTAVAHALAEIPQIAQQITACAPRHATASEAHDQDRDDREKDAMRLGVVVEGVALTVSAVLALLSHDQESLSAAFKDARHSILIEQKKDTSKTTSRSALTIRVQVDTPRRARPGDTTHLDPLAAALLDMDRWLGHHAATNRGTQFTLDGVDFLIDAYQTLEWLAAMFPRTCLGIRIGQLTCSGDLGPIARLESAMTKLLIGDVGPGVAPLAIESLVLKNPLDAETLGVFCSVVRRASSLQSIVLDGVLQDYGREPQARSQRWHQLACALFSHEATHRLQRVQIHEWTLLPEDVRAVVEGVSAEPPASLPVEYSLKISALELKIGGVQGGSVAPLAELLQTLRVRLPRLSDLRLSVADDPAINDATVLVAVEGFALSLRNLSLANVELDSLTSLLSRKTDHRLRLSSLRLENLFVGDMDSCTPLFEELLRDPTHPITRHLETLRIDLSARHTLSDVRRFVALVVAMLAHNVRLVHCEIVCHGDFGFASASLEKTLDAVHDQRVVAPVRLESRAAFLSVFHQSSFARHQGREEPVKRPRVERSHVALSLPQLNQDGIAHIFGFAASATKRIARVRVTKGTNKGF